MDATIVSRPNGWQKIAVASVKQDAAPQVAADDAPGTEGRFVRGAMIGLVIVAPFWAAVAWSVVRLLH